MRGEAALRHVTARDERPRIVAAGLTRHQRTYAVDGLRRADCRFVDSFEELERQLQSETRCDALIVTPRDPRGRDVLPTIQRLATAWPQTAIVIFCPPNLESGSALRSLVLAGAHEIVFEGIHDTAAALGVAVQNARRDRAAETVFASLQAVVPTQLHSMAHTALSRPDSITSVGALADAMGLHRKTLVNRCAQLHFLQPGELLVWCRLAMVAYFLERTGSTIESIALVLGFPSHTALRNLMKRYTGRRATEVRAEGGVHVVVGALEARLVRKGAERLPIA